MWYRALKHGARATVLEQPRRGFRCLMGSIQIAMNFTQGTAVPESFFSTGLLLAISLADVFVSPCRARMSRCPEKMVFKNVEWFPWPGVAP